MAADATAGGTDIGPARHLADRSQAVQRHVRFPPKADMCSAGGDVRFGPKADITPASPPPTPEVHRKREEYLGLFPKAER